MDQQTNRMANDACADKLVVSFRSKTVLNNNKKEMK